MAKKSPKIVEVVTPLTEALVAQVCAEAGLTVGEMIEKLQVQASADDGVYGPLPMLAVESAVTPAVELAEKAETKPVEGKAPRTPGMVDLSFVYRTQSAAFIEILLPGADAGEAGRVSWLRKSALKSWEVDVDTATVKVVMPRALATRRKFAVAA